MFCIGNDGDPDFIDMIDPCRRHQMPIKFVCLDEGCASASLLCNQCIDNHRDHKWVKITAYFSKDMKKTLVTGESKVAETVRDMRQALLLQLKHFQNRVVRGIQVISESIDAHFKQLQQHYIVPTTYFGRRLNNATFIQLNKIYEMEKEAMWITYMGQYLYKMVDQTQKSIHNMIEDMSNIFQIQKWDHKQHNQCEEIYQAYLKHLHKHQQVDPEYFRFNQQTKHSGVKLSHDLLQATYFKSLPSRPAAILNNILTDGHNTFGIEIIKLDSKAIFFASTTIYIGVCIPALVRNCGYRKINQAARGAYMIGSSGWTYHHSNVKYDRKDIVGWGFGQGDKVEVEIDFEGEGKIMFRKTGRFFNNKFQMPLDLKPYQLKTLKPCISFDAQQGAIVKVFNQVR